MAVLTPTTSMGTSATPAVATTGAVAGDEVVLILSVDNVGSSFAAVWPAGFANLDDRSLTLDGHRVGVAWKRLTGTDAGSYTMGNVGAGGGAYSMIAIPVTGRHATDPVVIGAVTANNTANAGTSLVMTANGLTAVTGDDLLHVAIEDVLAANIGNGHSAWSLGTEIVDIIDGTTGWINVGVAKAENVAAGATGNEIVTFSKSPSGSNGYITYLIRLPAAAGAGGQSVTVGGIASGETFGSATVQPGPVDVAPAGIASGEAFGAPVVQPGAVATAPTGIASGEAFGAPVVSVGGTTIAPAGITSGEAFGSATVTPGPVSVTATGIASGEAFGAPTVTKAQQIAPAGIPSGEAFGSATVTVGAVTLTPTGIASSEAFGAAVVARGNVNLAPAGIPSASAFGATTVTTGPATISPSGIPSAGVFGSATVARTHTVFIPDLPIGGRLEDRAAAGALWDPAATLTIDDPGAAGALDPRPIGGTLDG